MSRWITDEIVKTVSEIPEITIFDITGGEDHTTKSLSASVKDSEYKLYIRGFSTNHTAIPNDDNVDVEMIEVTSGYSDGDMPNDPEYVIVHARVKAALMKQGHCVVNSLDPYF
jgi:hypothetical protein